MTAAPGTPLSEFDYPLPEEAIAQVPLEPRSSARLLDALEPGGAIEHRHVVDLPDLLGPGDALVVNDSRVLRARLRLRKETGGRIEVLLLAPVAPGSAGSGSPSAPLWEALVRPARRAPSGTVLYPDGALADAAGLDPRAPVLEIAGPLGAPAAAADADAGIRHVRLIDPVAVEGLGVVPLPPYIHEELADQDRYQTVYARVAGSVAAPTAGLHFTPELLGRCEEAGAKVVTIDLAVGLGTFRPVTAEYVEDHSMHGERYRMPEETWRACQQAQRVIAVGTTSLRCLESVAAGGPLEGETDLYVRGAYPWRVVDVLLTNFHLPRSSLLVLLDAFAGPRWRDLYALALGCGYRFLSFGDAMIVARHDRLNVAR